MNKIAFFVEGQTEQLFVEKVIVEIAGRTKVTIEKQRITGGVTCKRRIELIDAVKESEKKSYFILIVDCSNDEAVKSRIVEEYDNLVKSKFTSIIGIRDLHPVARADQAKLERGLSFRVKTQPIQVEFILAIMEIEAWFLAEYTHFVKIDAILSAEHIEEKCGFNPSVENMELRDTPAIDLKAIYQLADKAYTKRKQNVIRTVEALDYGRIYLDLPERYLGLKRLVNCIESFFS